MALWIWCALAGGVGLGVWCGFWIGLAAGSGSVLGVFGFLGVCGSCGCCGTDSVNLVLVGALRCFRFLVVFEFGLWLWVCWV